MSKQTVIDEAERKMFDQYKLLSFVEFLEFLARLADLQHRGSELEGINLAAKVNNLLCEVLGVVDWTVKRDNRYKLRTDIEQSDSESD